MPITRKNQGKLVADAEIINRIPKTAGKEDKTLSGISWNNFLSASMDSLVYRMKTEPMAMYTKPRK
jgi:hypothetical protein